MQSARDARSAVAHAIAQIEAEAVRRGLRAVRGPLTEGRTGPTGRTAFAAQGVVARSAREPELADFAKSTRTIDGVFPGTPRRALVATDFVFAFLLLAMLAGIAMLEPTGLRDADPFAARAALVVLAGVACGATIAGAVLSASTTETAVRIPLVAAVSAALLGPLVWLVRARSTWSHPQLRTPYRGITAGAALAAAAWIVAFGR